MSQLTFICPKSALEALEKDVKHVQKTPERLHCRRFGIFKVNFEHILNHFVVFPLLALIKSLLSGKV